MFFLFFTSTVNHIFLHYRSFFFSPEMYLSRELLDCFPINSDFSVDYCYFLFIILHQTLPKDMFWTN